MNRHQSNPFLAGWEEPDVPEKPLNSPLFNSDTSSTNEDNNLGDGNVNAPLRRHSSSNLGSSTNPYQRPVDRRLLHRNMSSFEAASLHQQMQENGSSDTDCGLSGELIAKMTADFKSNIESNEKQFLDDSVPLEGFNPFDPFETIIDDDPAYTSPGIQSSQTTFGEKSSKFHVDVKDQLEEVAISERENFELDLAKKNHESIDDDEDELVSTPVRNIKCILDVNREPNRDDSSDTAKIILDESINLKENADIIKPINDPGVTINDPGSSNSIEKAHLFASLLASAEASPRINKSSENVTLCSEDAEADVVSSEHATHVVRGSSSTGDERPIGFFDPFETVIDKDALTSLMSDNQKILQNSSQNPSSNSVEEIDKTGSFSNLGLCHTIGDQKSIETVIENEASSFVIEDEYDIAHDYDNKKDLGSQSVTNTESPIRDTYCPIPRPVHKPLDEDQSILADVTSYIPRTPRRKAQKQTHRDSTDSSDSSEDDHIRIVIKARGNDKASEEEHQGEPHSIPRLPPPPSKNAIKQAIEKGLIEDSPALVAYKKKFGLENQGDSHEEPDRREDDLTAITDLKQEAPNQEQICEIGKETEDDEDEKVSDGEFIIRMRSVDEVELGDEPLGDAIYDEDTSYELEPYPKPYEGNGWSMLLRYPPKKKFTSNRSWKRIGVKLEEVQSQPDPKTKETSKIIALQIYDQLENKKPMQEIPLEATYTVTDISCQQLDQYGKVFTVKLQYVFYKERVGVRQGQIARFMHTGHVGTSTTSGGHGVDPLSIGAVKRLGAPFEHSPQVSQIVKLGSTDYDDIRQFKNCLEDYLFKMPITRVRPITTHKIEEVQMVVRDETYVELNQLGSITKQLARVRMFFLSFLNGMPTIEVGINDIRRQGKEVVGRMDILPVITEEWIRLESCELHPLVDVEEFENPESKLVKFVPPDATFFELIRFRVRPPKNQELPLQISADTTVTRTKATINVNVIIPGSISKKYGPIACENVAIRVAIPECWIYQFRSEKHFRMGSKKSVKNTPGRIKGMGRFLSGGVGGGPTVPEETLESRGVIIVTSGQAKYEHHYRSIVWRAARWPKENQSVYVQNSMKIELTLTDFDTVPESYDEYVYVEYTMPATTVSHTTCRSIAVNPVEDEPPEKFVKYSAKYEYKVKMLMSINLDSKQTEIKSPIAQIIKREQDLPGDLQREEDSEDDEDDSDDVASKSD